MTVEYHNLTKELTTSFETTISHIFQSIIDEKSMQVIFVDDIKMKEINLTYRNLNETTDVLSFESDEEESLGDIFISLDKAKAQAINLNHSLAREIGFLAVHGYLHLKGYDHDTAIKEQEMFQLQEDILAKANLKRG